MAIIAVVILPCVFSFLVGENKKSKGQQNNHADGAGNKLPAIDISL
jgi:hypothetical protein